MCFESVLQVFGGGGGWPSSSFHWKNNRIQSKFWNIKLLKYKQFHKDWNQLEGKKVFILYNTVSFLLELKSVVNNGHRINLFFLGKCDVFTHSEWKGHN